MRTLIFSDVHLTTIFDQKLFDYLASLISSVDQVIINGDFWDGQLTTIDEFVSSSWSKLFPYLKSKKTVYLYGNHDRKKRNNKNTKLFSIRQSSQYKLHWKNKTLVIEHGDRLCPFSDSGSLYQLKFLYFLERLSTIVTGNKLHRILYQKYNDLIKSKLPMLLKPHEIYICGHTHVAEYNLEKQFINDGFIQYGLAQYVLVDDQKIQLVMTRYK